MDGEVSNTELALNFELTAHRALLAQPKHALHMTVLPLQERASVLRQAVRAVQPHMVVGHLQPGEERPHCKSIILLGGAKVPRCEGAAVWSGDCILPHTTSRCGNDGCSGRSTRPLSDFLNRYYPPPPPFGGWAPLRPDHQTPRTAVPTGNDTDRRSGTEQAPSDSGVPSRRGLGKGRGSTEGLCPLHGAPSCRQCLETRQGVANYCRYGHEGHLQLSGALVGRSQCISWPGMRELAERAMVAATHGMHGWLRRLQLQSGDEPTEEACARR